MTTLYMGLAASLLVGVLLGMLGGGGSILTVPLLVYVMGVEPRTAIAMSLVVVGVTSASGAVVHARAGRVRWRTALIFGGGGMAGAFLGGRLNPLIPSTVLLLLFAGVMSAAAVAMLRRKEAPPASATAPAPEALPVARVLVQGLVVGLLSGLVGAGGGFLIVPALALVGLPTPVASATSLVVIALQCAAGFLGHLGHVQLPWELTGAVLVVAMTGSLVGGRLAEHVSPATLRRSFAVFVLATAAVLLVAQAPAPLHAMLEQAGAWPWAVAMTGVGLPLTLWRLRGARHR
ncbi:sulfite exporter TauE/SafE family protein [Pyxidicoccus xibeiensis]|uniref:sulfite exporter TauE/SafE family protein n=1 Tax=Pyxidicoccus xibeiensis TaxID=2906759 RepID=UPI0020A732EA|nr:sulfite exporter TauE/SafE family protein [Pyxidicoccus xibeiensis]MCP3136858.1 sulfite exporter TauE/SafE family protein [Pyxidicoccus xibeiensis]